MSHSRIIALWMCITLNGCFLVPSNKSYYMEGATVARPLSAQSLSLGGDTSCAIGADKKLWCWGDNQSGKISSNLNQSYFSRPQPVAGPFSTYAEMQQNDNFACGIDQKSRALACWGKWHTNGFQMNESIFVASGNAELNFSQLTLGQNFGCATSDGKHVHCFGPDRAGRGDGFLENDFSPQIARKLNFWVPQDIPRFSSYVRTLKYESDGSLLVGGEFVHVNDVLYNRIVRIKADGAIDQNFPSSLLPDRGFNGPVLSIAIDSDQAIWVGGNFTIYNGIAVKGLVKISRDGTLLRKFDNVATGFMESGASVRVIEIVKMGSGNDQIYVGGKFTFQSGGYAGYHMIRLNNEGEAQTSFNTNVFNISNNVYDLAVSSETGHLYVSWSTYSGGGPVIEQRQLDTGMLINGFPGVTAIGLNALLLLPDGALLAYDKQSNRIRRYHSSTTAEDTSFSTLMMDSGAMVTDMVVDSSGFVTAVGSFKSVNGNSIKGIVQFNGFTGEVVNSGKFAGGFGSSNTLYAIDLYREGGEQEYAVGGFLNSYTNFMLEIDHFLKLKATGEPMGSGYDPGGAPVVALQASGSSACALLKLSSTRNDLFCWGANGFAQISSGSSGLGHIFLSPTHVASRVAAFRLTPSRLCYESSGVWSCQGAKYEESEDGLGSMDSFNRRDRSFDLQNDWILLTSTILQQNLSRVGASTSIVYFSGSNHYESFSEMPYECRNLSGDIYCHGNKSAIKDGDDTGRVGVKGDGVGLVRLSTSEMIGDPRATSHTLGRNHGCLISKEGYVHCWGDNSRGQLGTNKGLSQSFMPIPAVTTQ